LLGLKISHEKDLIIGTSGNASIVDMQPVIPGKQYVKAWREEHIQWLLEINADSGRKSQKYVNVT